MWDRIGERFVTALREAASERLGPEHPLPLACAGANIANLRAHLSNLPAADADAILADAHRRLREDPAAWLDAWRPARPN